MDFRATNDNINRNNVDSEVGTLERFEAELKNTIFGVMFVLLKEQEVSIYTSFILAILQFLQLMIFPFHKTINKVWNSPKVVDVLSSIFNYFNIVPYLDSTTFSLYLTFFYVGMAILAIAILNMLYISYAFARRTLLSFTWPIILLRYIATLFITILFLPYIDYFVSMLACVTDTRTSTLVHSYFTEIECWTGTHVIHAIFAIIGTLAFVLFTSVVSLTYFEYKSVTNDPNARINARPNFLFILYKFVMVICLTFLTGDQFEVLLLALILVGSLILFIKFYFRTPYHNETVSKMWSTLTAVNLWTAVMLVFAKIMENTLFEGSIIAWLLGMPFIILIIVTNRDHRVDLLLINVNKFQNGEEIHEQIRYLLKLIEWQATNRNSAILLDGYIEIHKQSCNQEDCPLKQKSVKTSRQFKKLMEDDALNEKYAIVIQLLYKMYSHGIKKFPNNTSLRIAFAFFLLEKMQSKQQALQELSQAEQNKPPFDEQFIIYRYKKIVEDEIAESQTEAIAGLDFVSESAFQNHLRLLQANIEKSALLHMEFWSQLSEDNPDLSKLNDIGSKINSSVHNVEENWNKLLKINSNNAKAMRLYGKFLIEIINDKEAGDELLEKARTISNVQSNKKAIQMVGAAGDDYNSDATPTVWVSGEQEKFGIITGINLAAASLFGYNKTELLNRKVKDMMPPIYAKHHDSFIESYINTGEGPLIGKNKERLVFGKNKSGYIFPVYLSLKAVQSIIQGIQFIATFRVEKTFKNTAYVLAQPDGTIDAISASTISLMKFDIKSVNQKKTNIQDLIPNIIRDRHNMFSSTTGGRTTTAVTYSYPKDSEYLVGDEEATTNLNCQLVELLFLEGRENAGYQFKFERILDKSQYNAHDKKAKISNFQFRFERNKPCIVGEYVEGSTTTDVQSVHDDDVLSGLQNGEQNHSERELSNSARKSQNEEEPENTKIDYGRGIKTLRLVNGKPMDIEENVPEDEEEEGAESYDKNSKDQSQSKQHQQLAQQEEDQQDEGSYKEFSTTFKSRKALTSIVNDKTPPPAIKSLRYIANFIVVVLFVIALLDYLFAINEFDKINNEIDLLDKSNIRLAELMNALSKIRDITLINLGLLGDLAGYDAASLKLQLQNSLNVAKSLKETLEQSTSTLSTDHLTLLNSNSIPLYSLGSSLPVYKGLTQATEEIISRAFDINSKNSTQIFSNDSDVYFVTYNMLNGFYQGLRDSSGYYAQELSDQVNSKGSSFLIVLIVSIATLVVALLILFPIFFQVNKTREEVLGLFLDIPEKTVKGLYNKCETFISNLQVGEDEDMISEIDEEDLGKQQTEHDNQDFIPRRRRKRFKNLGRSQRTLFIKFLGVTLVIEAYFLFTFISANVLMEDISTLIPELNSTSAAEPFFSFANNAERQLLVNYNFSILFGNAETVATNDIKAMYDLDSLVLEEHSINRKIHTDEYAAIFNQLMMANPCDFMLSLVTNATCTGFADQTVFQGMTVALSRHFENLRTLLSCFTKLKNSSTCTVAPTTSKTVSNNTMLNSMMNLMRTSQATEIDTMQHTYIKQTFRLLMASFKSSLKDSFNDALTVRLIVFIIFVVVLAIIYVFLWLVLMAKITNEIWRTKSMLNMIPLNVISKIKSIRLYLKRFWNERNLAEY